MKKLLSFALLLLLIDATGHAQQKWAVGYQLTIGNSNLPPSNLTSGQDIDMKPMITNQLFLQRKITRKLNLELAFGLTSWKKTYTNTIYTNPLITEEYKVSNIAYNLTLTAKLNILQKLKWILYVPFGINSVYHQWHAHYGKEMLDFPWMVEKSSETQIGQNIFTGLGINYDLSKRLYFNGQATIGYKLYNALQDLDKADNETHNVSYSFQAGIGYRF